MEFSIFPTKSSAIKWANENLQGLRIIHKANNVDIERLELPRKKSPQWILNYRESDLLANVPLVNFDEM